MKQFPSTSGDLSIKYRDIKRIYDLKIGGNQLKQLVIHFSTNQSFATWYTILTRILISHGLDFHHWSTKVWHDGDLQFKSPDMQIHQHFMEIEGAKKLGLVSTQWWIRYIAVRQFWEGTYLFQQFSPIGFPTWKYNVNELSRCNR